MKCIYIMSMVLAVAIAQEKYDVDTDSVNLEDITANKEELTNYIQCFYEAKPCVGLAVELKKNARDAINTGCTKCTDGQKHLVKELLKAFETIPEEYKRFKDFYDPQGTLVPVLIENTANY